MEQEPPFWQGLGLHAPAGAKLNQFYDRLFNGYFVAWRLIWTIEAFQPEQ